MPDAARNAAIWFAATKLHPPIPRADTIRRPHLEEALRRSASTLPLTLLSAPAGYGKTTMLSILPRLLPDHPLAWVTLDAEDNDPIRFIGLVTTALQQLHPDCGRSVWPLLPGGANGAGLKRAVDALINEMLALLPSPFILVLDDLHAVTEPSVYVALEYLLEHQPPQLHLAVGTRHDPPLRLARLAARRQLAELRRPDLGFTQEEASRLLNDTLGLNLSPAELAALQQRTEGWPAGLCLLAGPLERLGADRAQFMAALAYTERYALDFLADEVLRGLPDEQRRFLLQTAILAEMTPSACRAVTGREDAGELLEELFRRNLTIASLTAEPESEPVYRHHALFARLLTRQLERELPGEVAELHRRAAQVQKTPGRAIAHYLAAGLWDEAAERMAESGMQLLHSGMAETIRGWYRALPPETQAKYPRLTVLVARCEIHCGDYDAAGRLLRQAREAFAASGDAPGEGEAVASLITLTYQNDDRAAAAELVACAARLPLSPLGQVAARLARAWLHLSDCDWESSLREIREALAIPRATGDRRADVIGITYMSAPLAAIPGCLEITERYCAEAGSLAPPETAWRLGAAELGAWLLLWRGRADEALAQVEEAEALRQRLGGYPFVGTDLSVLLTLLHAARGETEAANRAADTMLQRMEGAARGKRDFYLHAAGRALSMLGRRAEALDLHRRLAALPERPLTAYLRDHLAGLLALLEGRLAEATESLDRAAVLEERLPIAWVGGSARLLGARVLLDQGRSEEALAAAEPVLSGWERAGTPGCALLDGAAGLPVLKLAAERGSETAARLVRLFSPGVAMATPSPAPGAAASQAGAPDAASNRAGAPVAASPGAARLSEPLTPREQEVLRLIVAGRTNRQIGAELFIAEETVKSHVVHILRKLDVTSRTQAAIRGREMGF